MCSPDAYAYHALQLFGIAARATSRHHDGQKKEAKVETKKTGFLHQQETGFLIGSLTMTYFHTGIRTIIGAESFHCPVRDGKEWDQLAMVIRLKRFLTWCVYNANQISQFAESINVSASILIASRREHHALRDTHRPNVFRFKQSDRRRY